jgi:hypothetical protein
MLANTQDGAIGNGSPAPLTSAILQGKRVIAPPREVQEARNAIKTDSAPFIEFMLSMMRDAIVSSSVCATPQVAPQVTPQVLRLLACLKARMTRDQLQVTLGLKDRKSFRELYLQPALKAGFVVMTLPDKPNSRLQQYQLTASGKTALLSDAQ